MQRLLFDLLLFVSVLVFPWWLSLVLAIVGFFIFPKFIEYLICCIILFVLYSYKNGTFWSTNIFLAFFTTFSYLLMMFLKRNIIYYKK